MHKVLKLISPGANSSSKGANFDQKKNEGANLRKMRVLDQVKVQKMRASLKGAEHWPFFAQGAEKCTVEECSL